MTHRPIAPIALNGFEPGGTPRALPIFEWVDPSTLLVDEGYQRDSSERSLKLVRKIVAGWDWARFKSPVGVLTDSGIELIDGQHTAIAAATHPDITQIPVMIVDVKEQEDRASAFIGHNKDRIAVTAPQLHVAAVAAGQPEALAIQRVAGAAGVTVLRGNAGGGRYKPGETQATNAIGALIRGRGEDAAIKVLSCLVRAGTAPINALHIKAADLVLNTDEYSSQITAETLAAAIASIALKIDSDVAVFRAAHPSTPAWKAMAILWFKARRGRTKPDAVIATTTPNGDLRSTSGKLIENISRQPSPISAAPKQVTASDGCKRDARPKLSGWIPGPFMRRCSGCDEKYVGDVKSKSCADCAYGCAEIAYERERVMLRDSMLDGIDLAEGLQTPGAQRADAERVRLLMKASEAKRRALCGADPLNITKHTKGKGAAHKLAADPIEHVGHISRTVSSINRLEHFLIEGTRDSLWLALG